MKKWLYHKDNAPRIFDTDAKDFKTKSKGWVDSPADLKAKPKAKPKTKAKK